MPTPLYIPVPNDHKEIVVNPIIIDPVTSSLLGTHCLNGAQITADGRSALAEFTRLSYLTGKDIVSFREATGVRHVTESGANSTQSNPKTP